MVAGLIGGFYAPTVVAGGYVTARLSRAGFVGLSDFIGGKIEAVFFRRRRRGTLSASNVRSPVRAAELTKGAPTMAPSPMSPEDAAKVADLLKSPLRSSSLEDLAAKLVTFVLATSIIEETVAAEPLDSEDLISIIRGAPSPCTLPPGR